MSHNGETKIKYGAKHSIDLGLAVLCALQKYNERFTHVQIGAACECHPGRISQIEKQALRKIRQRLRWGYLKNHLDKQEINVCRLPTQPA